MVQLNTDEGLVGVAVATPSQHPLLASLVEDVLLGEDPRTVTGLWKRMVDAGVKSGNVGPVSQAAAILDIALWDLRAKAQNEPLWKTLGGSQPRVNTHVSAPDASANDESLAQWFGAMARDFGFRSGKLKVGLDQPAALRRLALVKSALQQNTSDPGLMVDMEGPWSPKESILHVRVMEEQFDLTWVEKPARHWDFLAHKRVSSAIRAAVCGGESLSTPGDFLPHFQHHSLDIIQVSLTNCGITGAMQVADAAFGFELPVVLSHCAGNIHAHVGAVMPYCMSLEVLEPLPVDGGVATDIRIVDGWAVAGEQPGNGLTILDGEGAIPA